MIAESGVRYNTASPCAAKAIVVTDRQGYSATQKPPSGSSGCRCRSTSRTRLEFLARPYREKLILPEATWRLAGTPGLERHIACGAEQSSVEEKKIPGRLASVGGCCIRSRVPCMELGVAAGMPSMYSNTSYVLLWRGFSCTTRLAKRH